MKRIRRAVFLVVWLLLFGCIVHAQSGMTVEEINHAISQALNQTNIDLESSAMKNFITATSAYEELSDAEKEKVDKSDMETVQNRILESISSSNGIHVGSKTWYIKTNVTNETNHTEVLKLLKAAYGTSTSTIAYHKKISYTDIRTGEDCQHSSKVSLAMDIPSNYSKLKNPKIFTISRGELVELPVTTQNNQFVVSRGQRLTEIVIVDLSIPITKVSIDKTMGINIGQSVTLKPTVEPSQITEKYTLVWKSSNTKVATVNSSGKVTAKKAGTATITVSVKNNSKISATCKVTIVQGAHKLKKSVSSVVDEVQNYILKKDKNPTIGSEWFVLGLARNGLDLNNKYFKTYYNHFANYLEENKGKLTNTVKYTQYSKAILTVTAMGKDATNVAGYNLFKPLADFDMVVAQGMNGPIWALLALDCNPKYEIPKVSGIKNRTTRQKLIDYLVEGECKNGGWNLMGESGDSDLTGMALQALAPYYQKKGYEKVTKAVDRALNYLSTIQLKNGGYGTMGVETSESCVQVLTGLTSLGIEPEKDVRFVKGGYWTIENLLTYHVSKSGFMHVKAGAENNGGGAAGEVNGMATEQAFYGLISYLRLKDGKTALYDMSDVKVTKGSKGDGKGTGVETPTEKETTKASKKETSSVSESTRQRSTTSSYTPTRSSYTRGTVAANTTTTAANNQTTQAAKTKKKSGGWNFAAEPYTEEYSAQTESGETQTNAENKSDSGSGEVKDLKNSEVPVAALGFLGGFVGCAALEGGRVAYKKRKNKKAENVENQDKNQE